MSSERLEFLGDSVLNYLTADFLFARFPAANEGELTALRAALIKTPTLASLARDLDLGAYLRLSKGEELSGARARSALLADTFEALLAAIYLDGGLAAAQTFLAPLIERQVALIASHGLTLDYKSQLQRRVQAERNITPRYRVVAAEGPEHRREYTIEVLIGEERLGLGKGHSKQAAAQAAAETALAALDANPAKQQDAEHATT
jgi:ribonuclease-3